MRAVHQKGITGKGIGLSHRRPIPFGGRCRMRGPARETEEIYLQSGSAAEIHSPAVASIALGQTVGVAPGANLYYIAANPHGLERACQYQYIWEARGGVVIDVHAEGKPHPGHLVFHGELEMRKAPKRDAAEAGKTGGRLVLSISIDKPVPFKKGLGRDLALQPRTEGGVGEMVAMLEHSLPMAKITFVLRRRACWFRWRRAPPPAVRRARLPDIIPLADRVGGCLTRWPL